jgi:hypothetical protein
MFMETHLPPSGIVSRVSHKSFTYLIFPRPCPTPEHSLLTLTRSYSGCPKYALIHWLMSKTSTTGDMASDRSKV